MVELLVWVGAAEGSRVGVASGTCIGSVTAVGAAVATGSVVAYWGGCSLRAAGNQNRKKGEASQRLGHRSEIPEGVLHG
ncbi:MAG TPA: hypothetical protein EYQ67_05795 [Dehalococcoidia bacterium]|nr:hypothetical protein [Dehalococcoidia bacterium]